MPPITDHPLRYEWANELHARPFPTIVSGGQAVLLAIKRQTNAAGRDRTIDDKLNQWFVRESLVVSSVLDENAIVASDFRINTGGHMRFVIFANPSSCPARIGRIGRIGRIAQRLCEIETYKAMAMLGLPRALRAGDLLRTQVEADRSGQNQELLASMDARAALQLRLQETVEGLSVVAISYYAINLLSYLKAPLAYKVGIDKPILTALLVLPFIATVWHLTHRIKKAMH